MNSNFLVSALEVVLRCISIFPMFQKPRVTKYLNCQSYCFPLLTYLNLMLSSTFTRARERVKIRLKTRNLFTKKKWKINNKIIKTNVNQARELAWMLESSLPEDLAAVQRELQAFKDATRARLTALHKDFLAGER